jgi:hypothetical protein
MSQRDLDRYGPRLPGIAPMTSRWGTANRSVAQAWFVDAEVICEIGASGASPMDLPRMDGEFTPRPDPAPGD